MTQVASLSERRAAQKYAADWPHYALVDPQTLIIDESYQRSAAQRRVDRIANNFDRRRFGTIDLSERSNGKRFVVDGSHRTLAARKRKEPVVAAVITMSDDPKADARRFVEQAERRHMHSAVVFKAQLKYGDQIAIAMDRLFKRFKFEIPDPRRFGFNNKDNEIRAIGTYERVFKQHGEGRVNSILSVQRHAWEGESSAVRRDMILGLNRAFELYDVTHQELTSAIKRGHAEAFDLIARAQRRAHRSDVKIGTCDALGEILGGLI